MNFKKYFKEEDIKELKESKEKFLELKKESKEKILAVKKEAKEKIFDLKWGLKDLLRSSPSQEEQLERLNALYKRGSYDKVITIFESDESLKTNEKIVHEYLWSLWMNNETLKAKDLAHEYNKKFNTKKWNWLIGRYAEQQKWFDVALSYFDKSSDSDEYNRVKKIFDDYDSLYLEKKYKEVIEYFENKLYKSHSKSDIEIINKYLWSLWHNSGTEKKAIEKTKEFLKEYGDQANWLNHIGKINFWLGEKYNNDINFFNEAISFYQKAANDTSVKEVNDHIEKIAKEKQLAKVAAAKEEQLAKEAAAKEKQLVNSKRLINNLSLGKKYSMWNQPRKRFIGITNDGTVKGSLVKGDGIIPSTWDSEMFLIVDAGDGNVAFWNQSHKRFIGITNDGTVKGSLIKEDGIIPSTWDSEKFLMVDAGYSNVAFWNQSHKRFIRITNDGTVKGSPVKEDGIIPSNWDPEKFIVRRYLTEEEKEVAKKEQLAKEKQLAKEAVAREKQLAKEAVAREKQLAKEAVAREKQLAKDLADLDKLEAAEAAREKKNKTHEYSVSNGVKFCRYCGVSDGYSYRDCKRENGHKYNVKRVLKNEYSGPSAGYEYVPICKGCGEDSGYNFRDCN